MRTASLSPLSTHFSFKKLVLPVVLIVLLAIAVLNFTPAAWVVIGLLAVSALAVMLRLEDAGSNTGSQYTSRHGFAWSDGGTSRETLKQQPRNARRVVHDGGSFERSRSK